jgi:hypothetical protein
VPPPPHSQPASQLARWSLKHLFPLNPLSTAGIKEIPRSAGAQANRTLIPTASEVAKGKILDYAVEKCLDADGNRRCSKPFLVKESACYKIEWSTEGALSHTTVEVRDVVSDELVYYRDTNGEWTPEKNEVITPPPDSGAWGLRLSVWSC